VVFILLLRSYNYIFFYREKDHFNIDAGLFGEIARGLEPPGTAASIPGPAFNG
jgi:hypothetical protein